MGYSREHPENVRRRIPGRPMGMLPARVPGIVPG